MKVDIVKNMWISGADIEFFKEGSLNGLLGLHLHFTGQPLGSADMMADIIDPLTKVKLPKRKVVVFEGLFNQSDPNYLLLVRAFKSWKFMVVLIADEKSLSLPWLPEVNRLILKTDRPFVPVLTDEVWYTPPSSDQVPPEPRVPAPDKMLLYFGKWQSMANTVRFITEAENNWFLL